MRSWIDQGIEITEGPSLSVVEQLVEAGQPFWLDIENPTDEVIDRLAARLALHPLAVEDSKQFGQQGKLQIYGNVAMIASFGLDEERRQPVEVHCYYTPGFLITLHRAPSPALDALRREASVRPLLEAQPIRALHRLLSALHAPFPAFVLGLDERLDALEQRMLREADDDDLTELTAIRHQAASMRHILRPGRELAARMPLVMSLPGATPDTQLYVEDFSDELQRVVADLTAIEERCITLLGLQASLAGNHLAVVSRRLAAVATIFLPISFLAGFWGENFNVLTGTFEKGWAAFLILSVGLNVACVLVTVFVLRRRRWT
ncbi:magnesium transporter CorA family protein [Streptacidiphilus melanogenes]|uniref:magnesium transporter CorA family protein n=1 Tax=Streptacidiphilus melanogenes TaxID=411235 RepID=UPI0005AAFBFB|nr:magnesium transporter CorA family protein [Streptacidiphilus melanogenes]